MRRIALDAMGGDDAPLPEVEGAAAAVRERALEVILVGDEETLHKRLAAEPPIAGPGKLTIRHASQVVTMDDAPSAAFKGKKDSSMRVAFNLAASGEAEAVVSAGNSGAVMAHGLFVMKRIDGVDRPGIVTIGPTRPGGHCVVLDVGANTELKPEMLAQFAVLGATYARVLLGTRRPRVGVLSNGEEEGKGTELTREAHRLLASAAASGERLDFDFAGYAEGRDFFPGRFDVVVTDGFTGNIALKTYEGTARFIFDLLEEEVRRSLRFQLGAWLLMPAFRALKRRLEADEYGGALLLGVQGVAMICHGRATGKAIKNAIFAADRLAVAGLPPALTDAVARHRHIWEGPDGELAAGPSSNDNSLGTRAFSEGGTGAAGGS